jgi:16S rRNA processing protein RimM
MIKALDQDRICVGVVVGSHGLQGSVKIKSFMVTSDDIAAYGPLTDKDGKQSFVLDVISSNKKGLVAKLIGITDRTASDELRGLELYLSRDLLPNLEEDEFYYSDLVGLVVENMNGEIIGTVSMVDNYGAGEIIEVDMEGGGTEMYKMSLGVVPEIDLKNGRIVVNPPFEVFAQKNRVANKTEEN